MAYWYLNMLDLHIKKEKRETKSWKIRKEKETRAYKLIKID